MPGDRTEQASPHRREKARREGDILHSRELSAAAGTLAGVLCLGMLGPRMVDSFCSCFSGALSLATPDRWEASALEPTMIAMRRIAISALLPAAVMLAAIPAAAALSERADSRFTAQPLVFGWIA